MKSHSGRRVFTYDFIMGLSLLRLLVLVVYLFAGQRGDNFVTAIGWSNYLTSSFRLGGIMLSRWLVLFAFSRRPLQDNPMDTGLGMQCGKDQALTFLSAIVVCIHDYLFRPPVPSLRLVFPVCELY